MCLKERRLLNSFLNTHITDDTAHVNVAHTLESCRCYKKNDDRGDIVLFVKRLQNIKILTYSHTYITDQEY